MKILIATGLYPPDIGGPATYTKLLEERLPALGIEVVVLPFSTVRYLPPGLRHCVYFWKCWVMARGADSVYAQDTVSVGLPAAFAAKACSKKFLVRVPGDYAWEQARQRFGIADELDAFQTKKYGWRTEALRRVQRFVVNRAVATVVPSEYMKKIVGGWGATNVHVIYSSIEIPQIEHIPHKEEFVVVSSGRRVPWKGFDGIERVVAKEPGWRFVLIEGLPRREALGLVASADVFVLNSTYEGLSHALVEAMMLGTPVVATNVGGNPELIRDGVDGLLVPAKDDAALHAAIQKVQEDPRGTAARVASAKERVQAFSIEVTIQKLASLLTTI